MKFRNISGGPLAFPTLGIANVEPGGEFEVTGEPAARLAADAEGLVERTDKKTSDTGSEDGKK